MNKQFTSNIFFIHVIRFFKVIRDHIYYYKLTFKFYWGILNTMLNEIKNVKQFEDEGPRRWFNDDYFDLIVWYSHEGEIEGFQLCYDKGHNERALTWRKTNGYSHDGIDDGEIAGEAKMTPVLVADGLFDKDSIGTRFLKAAKNIDPVVTGFVYDKIKIY